MKIITTVAIVAIALSGLTIGAFAFERPFGAPPKFADADRPMPLMMGRPNPVMQALEHLEISSDQRTALKLLEAQMREQMDNLKSTGLTKEEEIISALGKKGFDKEKFSKILKQKSTKKNALRATYIKDIVALLTVDQIAALKNQLANKLMNDLGY